MKPNEGACARAGEVTTLYPSRGTARVYLPDLGVVTHELQLVVSASVKSRDYRMPEIGETVLCLFLGSGIETGFILGSVYTAADPVPVSSPDIRHWSMKGAGALELNRSDGSVTLADTSGSFLRMQGGDIILQSRRNILLNPGDVEIPEHLTQIFD